MLLLLRKEEIFNEASKALKHQQRVDETDVSNGLSDAKKLKTSVDENMPSFPDMMAYIERKVGTRDILLTYS